MPSSYEYSGTGRKYGDPVDDELRQLFKATSLEELTQFIASSRRDLITDAWTCHKRVFGNTEYVLPSSIHKERAY